MPSNARNIEFFIKYAPIIELLFILAPDKKGGKPQLPIGLLDRERGDVMNCLTLNLELIYFSISSVF